jgi:hypothetical protein
MGVDPAIQMGQTGEVPNHVQFRQLRKGEGSFPSEAFGKTALKSLRRDSRGKDPAGSRTTFLPKGGLHGGPRRSWLLDTGQLKGHCSFILAL